MRVLSLISLLMLSASAMATESTYPAGGPDCLIVAESEKNITSKWTGPCVDGYAHGEGKLEWFDGTTLDMTYEGGMKRGMLHGAGYIKRPDNSQLEAQFVDGKAEGFGIWVSSNGDRYDGNFKAGKRDGQGKMVYALGGSYEGQFRQGAYHGTGTITYAGGRRATYAFVDGDWPEKNVAPKLEKKYVLKLPNLNFSSRADTNTVPLHAPPDAGWAQLGADDKKRIMAGYALMDPSDEPPYPTHGVGTLLRSITEIDDLGEGRLWLHVKVGPDGKARSVTSYDNTSKRVTALVSNILMFAKYTPGKCAGVPCTMMYPLHLGIKRKRTGGFNF